MNSVEEKIHNELIEIYCKQFGVGNYDVGFFDTISDELKNFNIDVEAIRISRLRQRKIKTVLDE